jgi:hypothetical protein
MQNATTDHQMQTRGEKEAKRRRLARDPNKAMQEMMTTIDSLRHSLLAETAALKDADTKQFMALQDRKLDVARDYLDGMAQLLARKDELKNADPKLKEKLEAMRLEFAETAQENHAALQRMKHGMQRLGERIMEGAREAARKEEQFVYGASGQMQSGSKATIGINASA